MVRLLDIPSIVSLIDKHSLDNIFQDLMLQLKKDFSNWNDFAQIPRPAFDVQDGVIELMPVCNSSMFSFKCVNGHPKNPLVGKSTVVATGQLNDAHDGYPVLISEMTLLTALRTAAVSALSSDLLSRLDSKVLCIIGTGAQSEYQVLAHKLVRDIQEVRFFDTDSKAMDKFTTNMNSNLSGSKVNLVRCNSAKEAVTGSDIIIVCTACKGHIKVLKDSWIVEGQHINGLGGDCAGKTELDKNILLRSKVIVEYFEQSFIEGEIQLFSRKEAQDLVHSHLFEIICGKECRTSDSDITFFDSVGIGLEDFSILSLFNSLAIKYNVGNKVLMAPSGNDPKDLFSLLLRG